MSDGATRSAEGGATRSAKGGATRRARIRWGTCAWADHESFYPPGLKPSDRLAYYAERFPLVEVDVTFYRMLSARTFAGWAEKTPPDFAFNVKAYGALTRHHRQPRPGEEDVAALSRAFSEMIEPLRAAGKLRAVHFQFPPWFRKTPENEAYLAWCREQFPHDIIAFEFRHRSWFADEEATFDTLARLVRLDAVNVVCDAPQVGDGTVPRVAEFASPRLSIFRFHGRNARTWYRPAKTTAERFDYRYTREELAEFVPLVEAHAAAVDEVHLLMNNNAQNYAVVNATEIADLLGLSPAPLILPPAAPASRVNRQIRFEV